MVTYIPCDSWDRVFLLIKQGLRQANYPDLARGPGGTANICCIVGWYQKKAPRHRTTTWPTSSLSWSRTAI